VGRPAADLV